MYPIRSYYEKVVKHQERKYGETKFGFERFIRGPLDLLSVIFISKFSKRPMHFFGVLGTIVFIVGFLASAYLGISKLIAVGHEIPARITSYNVCYTKLLREEVAIVSDRDHRTGIFLERNNFV